MIEMGKKYRTRGGREVRIYAVDCGGEYPVHGAIYDGHRWYATTWTEKGAHDISAGALAADLIEVLPEVTVRREVFLGSPGGTVCTAFEGKSLFGLQHLGAIDITHNGKEIIKVEVVK